MAVYFIRRKRDPDGLIKIGFTRNVSARIRSLATATPGGVELLAACDGGASVEHDIHDQLSNHRVDGEWFRPSDEVMRVVRLAQDSPSSIREQGRDRGRQHQVKAEDENSDDINMETRFYLNDLVRREWKGAGDSPEEARNRVADRLGISREKIRKIWYAMKVSVDGDTYRSISNQYARNLKAEGRATRRHELWLEIADRINPADAMEREAEEYEVSYEISQGSLPAGESMAKTSPRPEAKG